MLKSWIENSELLALINSISEGEAEQYRRKLITYVNRYQEEHSFDILEDVFTYMQLKLEEDDLDFTTLLQQIRDAIQVGYYEYCLSLNEISAAYKIISKPTPLTRLDIKSFINHILEAFSCNYPKEEFLDRELNYLTELLSEF
ncbi:hypothetical protein ACJZVJ_003491 [Providencia stuartii]